MEGDLVAVVKVTALIIASMTYTRLASNATKPGMLRLLDLLPVLLLFQYLPYYFTSINLRFAVAFSLSWLSVFKLLLLAFGLGPLSPSLPLPTFIAVSSLPIKIRPTTDGPSAYPRPFALVLLLCVKFVLLALLGVLYQSHPFPLLLPVICGLYLYLFLELVLGCTALLAGSILGLNCLEPYFDAPYKSSSLQDYWGRRWNLMVTNILRPSVYHPVKSCFGRDMAFMAVFFVSGLMHEVIYYHTTFHVPTGEVTLFFILHGLCTAVEVKAKKAGWWRLPQYPALAVPLTLVFFVSTGFWLFFPQLLRGGWVDMGLQEYIAAMESLIQGGGAVWVRLIG